jgi:hypothetical protein
MPRENKPTHKRMVAYEAKQSHDSHMMRNTDADISSQMLFASEQICKALYCVAEQLAERNDAAAAMLAELEAELHKSPRPRKRKSAKTNEHFPGDENR